MVKGLYTAYTGMINEQKRLDGLFATLHAIACSLPPLPTINTFICLLLCFICFVITLKKQFHLLL